MARPLSREEEAPSRSDITMLDARLTLLEKRIGALQEFVDSSGMSWARNGVPDVIYSADSAVRAVQDFDWEWFKALPYSPSVVAEIAGALAEAARPFVVVNTNVWDAIAQDPINALAE